MRAALFVTGLTFLTLAACDDKSAADPNANPDAGKAPPVKQKENAEAQVDAMKKVQDERHDRILEQSMGEDGTVPER